VSRSSHQPKRKRLDGAMNNKAKLGHMTPLDMAREFSEVMGLPLDQPCQFDKGYDTDLEGLRYSLVLEEFNEFTDAHSKENLLKELADLVYVVYGYAATYGLNLDEAFRRVHESNMSKLDDNGEPVRRADGKVLKGPNYKEADLSGLV
jgi:hypothetical protein